MFFLRLRVYGVGTKQGLNYEQEQSSLFDTVLVNVKVNYMQDYKGQLIYVHEEPPDVLPCQGIHIHNVAVVGVHPQAARLHLLQAGAAERAGLGFGVPAMRVNQLCYGPAATRMISYNGVHGLISP